MASTSEEPLRVLELFCGIGGCAAALEGGAARVVAAIDVHRGALAVYRRNFEHPVRAAAIDSVPAAELARLGADLWWLSPPCQPYTSRGLRRDVDDPRARSLLVLLERVERLRPRWLALENVPGFVGSRMHERLRSTLERAGYQTLERVLCPSELGVPNRRRRFYLVAGLDGLGEPRLEVGPRRPLSRYLDAEPAPSLELPEEALERYRGALDVVDAEDPEAVTACFTSAYGRSWVRSGSYLRSADGRVRRFSPTEVLRLLGFPESFILPAELPPARAWPLVGNSLSITPVRAMLAAIPGLRLPAG